MKIYSSTSNLTTLLLKDYVGTEIWVKAYCNKRLYYINVHKMFKNGTMLYSAISDDYIKYRRNWISDDNYQIIKDFIKSPTRIFTLYSPYSYRTTHHLPSRVIDWKIQYPIEMFATTDMIEILSEYLEVNSK